MLQNNALSGFIINLFSAQGFASLLNFLILIIEVLYVIFAVIVVRQVNLLNKSFKTDAGAIFMLFSYVHLIIAIGLVLISLLSL